VALDAITSYVKGNKSLPLCIVGDPGSGRTSLVAQWAAQSSVAPVVAELGYPLIIPHFVGTTGKMRKKKKKQKKQQHKHLK
jgi:hypothetical protein